MSEDESAISGIWIVRLSRHILLDCQNSPAETSNMRCWDHMFMDVKELLGNILGNRNINISLLKPSASP